MRQIYLAIFILVVFVFSACVQPTMASQHEGEPARLTKTPTSPEKEWSEEESEEIAENLLLNSPTFASRGIEGSMRLIEVTPLEQSSSWQFDYEFKCEYPGYGWLGSEPTPPILTEHEARVIVERGEVIYAMLDGEWDALLAIAEEPLITHDDSEASVIDADLPEGNLVRLNFSQEYWYTASGDAFINMPVRGKEVWRAHAPINEPDETGAPIIRPRLTLNSELSLRVEKDKLVRDGPPTYEWYLEDIDEAPQSDAWGWDTFVIPQSPGVATPGYDASRSFDRTVFWREGTQTMTVTVTPREEDLGRFVIMVHTNRDDPFVDAVVLSYSGVHEGEASIAEGGHRSGIFVSPLELDTPVTVAITLKVTPKVPWVFYKPDTGITTDRPHDADSGVTVGRSASVTNEVGTWTWQAEGDYVWLWAAPSAGTIDVSVGFGERAVPILVLILVVVILGASILGIILYRRRRIHAH